MRETIILEVTVKSDGQTPLDRLRRYVRGAIMVGSMGLVDCEVKVMSVTTDNEKAR